MAKMNRTLIIEEMTKGRYLVSIRYKSKNIDRTEERFIIEKEGKKYILLPNDRTLITCYVPHMTLISIFKDIVFMKAFKKLIKSKAKSVSINYTLTDEDYIDELNEYLNI